MKATIALLPGDGIGPEVVDEAVKVFDTVAGHYGHSFEYTSHHVGGCAIDATGNPLPDETIAACRAADAVLLGAVGGPKWDDPTAKVRPEQGLLGLRKELGLFANVRPVKVQPLFTEASPLRRARLDGVDLIIIRELTGGLYFGKPQFREDTPKGVRAVDTLEYTDYEIRRIVELAFRVARKRRNLVTSVDKANVLETGRLWRQVATEVGTEFPDVTLEHQLVDSCAMRLVTAAASFDVVVTTNMFGDILSDEASVLTGSLGMLPSASLGEGSKGLYEPVHGSAPDIAGQGKANPLATIMSAAMLLRHSLDLDAEATVVEHAVDRALAAGARTADLGGDPPLATAEMGKVVCEQVLVAARG